MVSKEKISSAANTNEHASLVFTGRIAGLLYLTIIVCGIFSELFVRMHLIVPGDPLSTAQNLSASPLLFRAGFVADSMMLLSDVAVAIIFYVLLKPVDGTLALMASAFRLIQAAILGANLLNYHAAILLSGEIGYGNPISADTSHGLMMLFLDLHGHGYDLALLFFAVSNFILGHLIKKSGFFAPVFGYGLQAAAVVYIAGTYCRFVFPQYAAALQPAYFIPFIAELSFSLWLLAKGVNVKAVETRVN